MPDLPETEPEWPQPDHSAGYAPLTGFAAPARASAEVWRVFAVLLLLMFLTDFIEGAITQAIKAALGPVFGAVALVNLNLGLTPWGVVGQLALALPRGLVLLVAVGLVTGRGIGSLLGAPGRLWRDMAVGFVPLAALGVLLMPLLTQDPAVAAVQPLGRVLIWLPLALPALVLASASSELIFRGFLQQQLAARWKANWVWMGLPAALFALLQGAPAGVGDLAPLSLLWSLAFCAAAADLTARTGSLGAAIGLQAAILGQSLFLLGLRGPMNGLALYALEARGHALLPWLASDFLMLLVGWLSARVLLRV